MQVGEVMGEGKSKDEDGARYKYRMAGGRVVGRGQECGWELFERARIRLEVRRICA